MAPMTWAASRVSGVVAHSPAEPVFHERWAAVARALLVAAAGAVDVGCAVDAGGGEFRHAIERVEPGTT